jgi:hypothetical protein
MMVFEINDIMFFNQILNYVSFVLSLPVHLMVLNFSMFQPVVITYLDTSVSTDYLAFGMYSHV